MIDEFLLFLFLTFRSPTTIEDNYRKEIRITVHDEEVINRIQQNITNAEDEEEVKTLVVLN